MVKRVSRLKGLGLYRTWSWRELERGGTGYRGAGSLTEHGHVLAGVEVPVAPVGPVAVQRGVLLVVVGRLRPEGVDDSDMAPEEGHTGRTPGSPPSTSGRPFSSVFLSSCFAINK